MNKILIVKIIMISFFMIWGCTSSYDELDSTPPNIIIIYADDAGWGDIGVYGSELIPTPHIDQLAADGIRFTSAYATAATCTPSRYSLLTGEYAFRNERAQILTGDAPLLIEPGSYTLPKMLRSAGYRTSVVGKWHLGLGEDNVDWNSQIKPGPLEVGFDESFLLPATNDRVPTVYVEGHYVVGLSDDDDPLRVSYSEQIGNLPTGHSHPELLHYPADNQHSGTIVNGISRIGWQDGGQSAWWDDEQMAFEFTERSQEFIERQKDDPFFLFLSMHEPHVPRWPHPQFVGKSDAGLRGDVIVELDWVVGQIVETLEELGIREETLVIFTSDNGPIFFDGYYEGSVETAGEHRPSGPFRGGKYHTLEGGTRMPFIASWPGAIKPGMVSDGIFSQVDLLATLADLTGIELPNEAGPDSQNLLPLLLGQTEQGREFVVQQGAELAIRKGNWKYIPNGEIASRAQHKHSMGPTALSTGQLDPIPYLFNLEDDIGETTNLADDHPGIMVELAELLEQIRNQPENRLLRLNSSNQ
ncbi:MAG: arylsulfatase [Balneolaceae bacterium]|nr:arylsulfatase [Balneolaceae bacterium]